MIDIRPALYVVAPRVNADDWVAALTAPMEKYGISNTIHRAAAFLGQCSVETGGFLNLIEDMDYSAARILFVWPSRPGARMFAHEPENLANCVYANRMGNGPPGSGDGWRFRGRGLIQTTGRADYQRLATGMDMAIDDVAAWMETPTGAAAAACWDWSDMGCNALADDWRLTAMSERINGGTNALQARIEACNKARVALQTAALAPAIPDDADELMASELTDINPKGVSP